VNTHMKPTGHLVFRTTNIGHWECGHPNASRPALSRAEAWQQLSGKDKNIFEWSVDANKVGGRGPSTCAFMGRGGASVMQ
jgi:hypothetical protein